MISMFLYLSYCQGFLTPNTRTVRGSHRRAARLDDSFLLYIVQSRADIRGTNEEAGRAHISVKPQVTPHHTDLPEKIEHVS